MLPKRSVYGRYFHETEYMSFLTKYDESPKKYNKIWDKVSYSIEKELDSEPIYNFILSYFIYNLIQNLMRKKSKQFFMVIRIQNKGCQRICLLVILIGSVYRTGKNCYPQVLLE